MDQSPTKSRFQDWLLESLVDHGKIWFNDFGSASLRMIHSTRQRTVKGAKGHQLKHSETLRVINMVGWKIDAHLIPFRIGDFQISIEDGNPPFSWAL